MSFNVQNYAQLLVMLCVANFLSLLFFSSVVFILSSFVRFLCILKGIFSSFEKYLQLG